MQSPRASLLFIIFCGALSVAKVTESGKSSRFYHSDSSEWKSSATPADDSRENRARPSDIKITSWQ